MSEFQTASREPPLERGEGECRQCTGSAEGTEGAALQKQRPEQGPT